MNEYQTSSKIRALERHLRNAILPGLADIARDCLKDVEDIEDQLIHYSPKSGDILPYSADLRIMGLTVADIAKLRRAAAVNCMSVQAMMDKMDKFDQLAANWAAERHGITINIEVKDPQ